MQTRATYPSIEHERAAQAIADFFSGQEIDAVLLTCSCARGKASRGSCLDISVLIHPQRFASQRDALGQRWTEFYESERVFVALHGLGKFSHVDMDFTDGHFEPPGRGWTSGPDNFELEIGNTVAYSVPLLEKTDYFQQLKAQWLPFYSDELRRERLAAARKYCINNLDHIPSFVARGLYFQSFHRLYHAFQEFIQTLFISRRTYPIAYDKWVREQIEDILGMPELYRQLVRIISISDFESNEIAQKAEQLRQLFREQITNNAEKPDSEKGKTNP